MQLKNVGLLQDGVGVSPRALSVAAGPVAAAESHRAVEEPVAVAGFAKRLTVSEEQ